jgi:rare lipoprotein A
LRPGLRDCWLHVRIPLALTILAFVASACSTQAPPSPEPIVVAPPPPPEPTRKTTSNGSKGVRASYQGDAQVGRKTASGEIYDPNELTAASRTLPLGSKVIVTNPSTGRSVQVRINDRGPFVGGRSLDLSKRAADEIGLTEKGVGRVKIKRVPASVEQADSKSKPSTDSKSVASESSKPPTAESAGVSTVSGVSTSVSAPPAVASP